MHLAYDLHRQRATRVQAACPSLARCYTGWGLITDGELIQQNGQLDNWKWSKEKSHSGRLLGPFPAHLQLLPDAKVVAAVLLRASTGPFKSSITIEVQPFQRQHLMPMGSYTIRCHWVQAHFQRSSTTRHSQLLNIETVRPRNQGDHWKHHWNIMDHSKAFGINRSQSSLAMIMLWHVVDQYVQKDDLIPGLLAALRRWGTSATSTSILIVQS